MDEKLDKITSSIQLLERQYDSANLRKKDITTFKQLVRHYEQDLVHVRHKENYLDYSSQRATALSFQESQKVSLFRARIFELKGVIAFAEDDPLKAREYIQIAIQHIKDDSYPVSGLGRSYREATNTSSPLTVQGVKSFAGGLLVLILIFIFIYVMFMPSDPLTENRPDTCYAREC